jgi:hypothetical protein
MSPNARTPLLAATALLAGASFGGAACIDVLGIGDPTLEPTTTSTTGAGGAGGHPATTATTATSTATTGSGGQGGGVPAPCEPKDASCHLVKTSDCIPLVDNTGQASFTLRVGQIDFYKPDAFTGSFEEAAFSSAVTMSLPACNLQGSGTFSWIFEFDSTTGAYTIGASKPPAAPQDGYSFVSGTIMQGGMSFMLMPGTGTASIDAMGNIAASVVDFIDFPVYLDEAGMDVILVPLHEVALTQGVISADHNCIGTFNGEGLSPSNGCLPVPGTAAEDFVDGAKLGGYITLEEADQVILTSFGLNRSLCVLLSQAPDVFGNGGSPDLCKRDACGQIKFPGDWCAATNSGASPTCYDSMQFSAGLAASAVKLVPPDGGAPDGG